eukprot:CAMPEP_0172911598 /NCGR_PEP_ID=MMETSP1075-20121228/186846_1 /TAXON_ID=2916 /ORGANISM="Ceratium fusus, Strain PA161109" /LENGTH=78 /DNA_ID=CAMNT_0013769943 /DNA_START=37 /DNA_END=270 /DNA_ORIENTATION=+
MKPLSASDAQTARDALSRVIYGHLFLWLIQGMNTSLSTEGSAGAPKEHLIGVLDLAGFESFEKNSLEQLLINLSNEHL